MPQSREKKKRTKSIQESVEEIFEKAEAREKAGQDPFYAHWQASLEIVLLACEESLRPGQLLPMRNRRGEGMGVLPGRIRKA